MQYSRKPAKVWAIQFRGTPASAEAVRDFLSQHEVENTESGYQELEHGETVLDVTTATLTLGLREGDWLVLSEAKEVSMSMPLAFRRDYEPT